MSAEALALLLSPWMVGLLGLVVGSFLNVVVHRLPQMLERGWWSDVAGQLGDADSHRRVLPNHGTGATGIATTRTVPASDKRLEFDL